MSSVRPFPDLDPASAVNADEYIPGEFSEESEPAVFPQAAAEKTPDLPVTTPPALFMAAPQPPSARFGTLFWLAHTLGLDVYGTGTLSYAARSEMIAAALVLSVIFLFDAGAWCLLFYFILNSGSLAFHPGGLVLSLSGILPALALLLYERGFMISDTKSHGWRRLIFPTVMRLCVIFGAAWVTAQPVELMAFARRIERRVQDELIRKDIVGHYHKLQKAHEDQKRGSSALEGRDNTNLNEADNRLRDENGRLPAAQADLETSKQALKDAAARLQAARANLRAAQAQADADRNSTEKIDELRKSQQTEKNALAAYKKRVDRVSDQQKKLGTLQQEISSERADRDELRKTLEADLVNKAAGETEANLLKWADKIRGLEPGKNFPENGEPDSETGFKFTFADYSFLDKFRIIDDLRAGRPARWPGAEPDKINFLKETYGLYDDNDVSELQVNQKMDEETKKAIEAENQRIRAERKERIDAETRNADRAYYAVFGVALIIPFMSLLFKLIMPAPLSYYYSSAWQAKQGHPEALALEAAAYSMRGHSTPKMGITSRQSATVLAGFDHRKQNGASRGETAHA